MGPVRKLVETRCGMGHCCFGIVGRNGFCQLLVSLFVRKIFNLGMVSWAVYFSGGRYCKLGCLDYVKSPLHIFLRSHCGLGS